jgi:hypothetical protein
MTTDPATCRRCGSTKLRHARSRHVGHRWIRAWTDWDRYACGACGHRGWQRGRLRHPPPAAPAPGPALPGRRLERRDSRSVRRVWLRNVAAAVFALLLGAIGAWMVLRMAGAPPRPPEP